MERFSITGGGDIIEIDFLEVFNFPESICYYGGYDVKANIKINVGSFLVESALYTSTGELYDFFQSLTRCNEELRGTAIFQNYENNLQMAIQYDELGHVRITGSFLELEGSNNELKFEIYSDQTFIAKTLVQLAIIANKYGDRTGIKGAIFPY
jgi:hypothetical protein